MMNLVEAKDDAEDDKIIKSKQQQKPSTFCEDDDTKCLT